MIGTNNKKSHSKKSHSKKSNVAKFIIAIDAGGSKTLGRIICIATRKQWQMKSDAASLSQNLQLSCEIIRNIVDVLLKRANATTQESVIVCGAAGACSEFNSRFLNDYLDNNYLAKLVTTDAKISLYGAAKGRPILVVAIGTGSVAMRLDHDGNESTFGGWGFVAGDLGSGADIGRQLIVQTLIEFDKQNMVQDELISTVLESIGTDRQAILNWLKNATTKDYASLAPIVFDYQLSSKIAQSIIKNAASSIEQLIFNSQSMFSQSILSVALVGGLSNKIRQYLSSEIQAILVDAKGDALDGAVYLAEQLIKSCMIEN